MFISKFTPTRHRRSLNRRDGGAAVEAAICIPIIITLMLGTLEVCAGLYLSESLTVAAFEGCRAGVRRRSTAEDVRERVEEVLADRNVVMPIDDQGEITGITIVPENFDSLNALDPIIVRIEAPTTGNAVYIFDALFNRNVRANCSMVREFDD